MVSTRHHPRPFPEPATPTPSSRPNAADSVPKSSMTVSLPSPRRHRLNRSSTAKQAPSSRSAYAHKIPPLLIIWLCVSLPLVLWDTGYVFLRPHSMPGGKLHWPLWVPYSVYCTVDYTYGWPAYNGHVGFTAAQATLNAVETAMYIYYWTIIVSNADEGFFSFVDMNEFLTGSSDRAVSGPGVGTAVVVLFSAAVMTLSKTVLYWLNEYFSNFVNIGHNTVANLIWLWVIPNGLWLVFPIYMIYVLGREIVSHMDGSGHEKEE
ncbi:uncharacterized protein Z518_04165 [Rhinocladiella mackenziei CBS 650.93]|uniref:EXPERA domain-containing protein n=1 Tax=Rhinocladiella mackenziei CBS 650.93 TaxID=1442369 RepID=A0A0D2ISP8_9EURO|nr:uncharacterized protein Z518_04165 [Rhinocladiella mackenziei CBS 650.93]KIX06191.1 hypothetical protein Z518_04165 [Rhinocladiella mackenziei CBS 650.93]